MTPIRSGRMTIIPTLENDGWALPGMRKTDSRLKAEASALWFSTLQGPDLTTSQRAHHIKNGGMGYAKHDA